AWPHMLSSKTPSASALDGRQIIRTVLCRGLDFGDIQQRADRDVCADERRQVHDVLLAELCLQLAESRIADHVLAAQFSRKIIGVPTPQSQRTTRAPSSGAQVESVRPAPLLAAGVFQFELWETILLGRKRSSLGRPARSREQFRPGRQQLRPPKAAMP